MTAPDATLAKVRKLLAQAEDPACTSAEAEAFTAKAAQLVAAHGIDEALLSAADPDRDRVGDRVVDLDAPYAREKGTLGAEVARALRCEVVLRQEPRYDERWRVTTAFSRASSRDRRSSSRTACRRRTCRSQSSWQPSSAPADAGPGYAGPARAVGARAGRAGAGGSPSFRVLRLVAPVPQPKPGTCWTAAAAAPGQ